MLPSLLPFYDSASSKLVDGTEIPVCGFCKKEFEKSDKCTTHYQSLLTKNEGYYQCPFGFTTRSFAVSEKLWAITGVIAFPRFDTAVERRRSKECAQNKCSRSSIESHVKFFRELDQYRAETVAEAAKVLPQKFHELRKLNGAVLQHSEREMRDLGERRSLLSIHSAAELMRNNFDILEALSNPEVMNAIPIDGTVNVFDLVFKLKRVYQERAIERGITVSVDGVRAIIRGSQKSFPIVPQILIENAIKYGTANESIRASVGTQFDNAILIVENRTDSYIDTERCFERGVRFSDKVEGGGFGLYIAKGIVVAHGGTIRCEAREGLVRMVVTLPLVTVID